MSSDLPTSNKRDETIAVVPRSTLNYVIVAVTFLIVGMVMGVLAIQRTQPTLTEDSVERIVREVMADTSVGLTRSDLEDVVREVVADGANVSSDPYEYVDDDPYLGEEEAPIVIVEFSAYACPYCGRHFQQTFSPLLENYGEYIRYVYRDYPIINPQVSFEAALAAGCAQEQGAFWDYHGALFDNQQMLGQDLYFSLAEDMELDMETFQTCFTEQKYNDEVYNDYYDGQYLSITGTPAFLINGRLVSGAQPYAYFERLILRELEDAGIEVEGVSSADEITSEQLTEPDTDAGPSIPPEDEQDVETDADSEPDTTIEPDAEA